MKFGDLALDDAAGAVLAHSLRLGGGRALKKGRRLSDADIADLRDAGYATVPAARLEPGDLDEDTAARTLAEALAGAGLRPGPARTGRCNLHAAARGVVVFDRARLDAVNLTDESLTVATLPPFDLAEKDQIVATVKVIPFAAPAGAVEDAARLAADGGPLLALAPLRPRRAGLVLTRLPGTPDKLLEGRAEAVARRVEALGGTLAATRRCAHDPDSVRAALDSLRDAGCDLFLLFGASAITDRADVIPAATVAAGGEIVHFGMPVDPGNLLLLARLAEGPVVGLPGCARSPRLNGVDWVLWRLFAGLEVGREDIMRMGAGGLLTDLPERPLPRAESERTAADEPARPRVAALVLAAGRSLRMGRTNKLLEKIDGVAMVARVADAALASQASPVFVVTGHEAEAVRAALAARTITSCRLDSPAVAFVHNPAYADGLARSLRAGIAALPGDIDGVIVCLGDMPDITAAHLDALIDAFDPTAGAAICVPVRDGRRGNPVLWARRFFDEIGALEGDVGAKSLIGLHAGLVREVPVADDAVLTDLDSPADFAARETTG